ncbi:MAG: outer membrane protein assembly factor BamD [Deltaproteobacteria bacterium]|nr:outer membrane protein assembly factor BamD [Deltaproteobacteria bacterium]
MKKLFTLFSIFYLLFSFPACGKKRPFGFTGKENEEQAFNKCVRLSSKKQFQEAVDCLEIFKSRYPDSKYSGEAELRIADTYFAKKEYLLSAETYLLFAKLHPTSEKLDYTFYRAGLCYWHAAPKSVDRNQENLPEAVDNFRTVVSQYSTSPYAKMAKVKYDEARRRIANRHYYIGKLYYRWGEYLAAIPRFKEIIDHYSHLGLDEEALYFMAISYNNLGKIEEAKVVAELMKEEFPDSKRTKKITNRLKKS